MTRNAACLLLSACVLIVAACGNFDEEAADFEQSVIDELTTIVMSADASIAEVTSQPAIEGDFTLSRQKGAGVPRDGIVILTSEPIGRIERTADLQPLITALADHGYLLKAGNCLSSAQRAAFSNDAGGAITVRVVTSVGMIELSAALTEKHELGPDEFAYDSATPLCWPTSQS